MNNNVEDVLRWLDLNDLELWTVSRTKDKNGNTKIFDSKEDETLMERKQRFRDTMKLMPSTWFYVTAKRSRNQTTGMFEYEFINGNAGTSSESAVSGIPSIMTGVPKDEVSSMIAKAIEDDRRERRLQELEAENRELKKEVDENGGSLARILHRAEPVIGMLMDRMVPQRPTIQVAGLERSDEAEEVDADLTDRVQTAVDKWAKADEDFITVLEFISDFAASGNTIDAGIMKLDYQQVKQLLK